MKYEFDAQLDPVQRPAFDHGPIKNEPEAPESLPPLTRALVLAYQIKHAVIDGQFTDYANAARQLKVSRARISQLMKLTNLAPPIQEVILCEPDRIASLFEKSIRPIAAIDDHDDQWRDFQQLLSA